ncbi:hypothetical protein AB205_0027470, partial [Aquarana catesbeiana]
MEVKQCFKDKDGRFVIIKGVLHNREITIASIYAPNDAPASFFKSFFDKLTSLNSPHIIIGGDFNLVANPTLDRSSSTKISKAFPRSLTQGLLDYQLVDTWKTHNMGLKEFTFYSHPHNSYARLDYIYTTPIILANSTKATIHPCVWSDHHVTSFTTKFIGLAPTPYIWRLNEALLSDVVVESETAKSIEEYFSLNALPDTPPSFLWTAHKAVIRGLPTSHPKEVLQIFEQFYSSLLSPNLNSPTSADDSWFQDINIPTLSTTQVEKLNAPITTSEVLKVIKSLKTGSAPGPDGFSAIYYKKFASLLSPGLAQLFNWILQGGNFPEEMLLANMSLIPKPNKSRFLIPDREFYHFLQIRHFFQHHYLLPHSDHSTIYEDLCRTAPRQKGLISQIHGSLVSVEDSLTLKYRSQWEQDLALDQDVMDWDRGWLNI